MQAPVYEWHPNRTEPVEPNDSRLVASICGVAGSDPFKTCLHARQGLGDSKRMLLIANGSKKMASLSLTDLVL